MSYLASDKQISYILSLLNKIGIKDKKRQLAMIYVLGNNSFKILEMTNHQASSIIWKLEYIQLHKTELEKEQS